MIVFCKICNSEINRSPSLVRENNFCSRVCYNKFRENNGTRKGCVVSQEARQKMSVAATGEKNSQYGKSLSLEHRAKISESNKGKHFYWKGKKQPQEMIDKRVAKLRVPCSEEKKMSISASNKGKKRNAQCRYGMSKRMIEKYKNGYNPNKNNINGHIFSEKNNKRVHYRSSYELDVIHILENDNKVLKYEVEELRIPYTFEGKFHVYVPDFTIYYDDGSVVIVEVKPQKLVNYGKNNKKIEKLKEFCCKNNFQCEVWTEEVINDKRFD